MPNLLFVCSKNQWRSPTAELLFKNHHVHIAKSAGTSSKARVKLNQQLINWADIVFVMERKHKEMLKERFPLIITTKTINVLDIEDKYPFGDPALIEKLQSALKNYL